MDHNTEQKKLSKKLFIGVIFIPIIFVWFVDKSYPNKTRFLSFFWLFWSILINVAHLKNG